MTACGHRATGPDHSIGGIAGGKTTLLFAAATLLLLFTPSREANAQLPRGPIQAYLAVDHFELRFEVALRLPLLEGELDTPTQLTDASVIAATERDALLAAIAPFLENAVRVSADGAPLSLELDHIDFVTVDEDEGVLPDARDPIPVESALVAAIFATPRAALPGAATVEWSFFPRAPGGTPGTLLPVPLYLSSPGGDKRAVLLPAESPAKHTFAIPAAPSVPAALEVPPPPPDARFELPALSVLCLALFVALTLTGLKLRERTPKVLATLSLAAAAGAVLLWNQARVSLPNPLSQPEPVSVETADEIVFTLLRNVYHAFDYRSESAIYNTLELSADGNLLTDIYLEIQRSLQLENQGGARVRITNVDLRQCEPGPSTDAPLPAFAADCEWIAIGSVTHWGHTHTRLNKYLATLQITPVDGRWKITALDLKSEERL